MDSSGVRPGNDGCRAIRLTSRAGTKRALPPITARTSTSHITAQDTFGRATGQSGRTCLSANRGSPENCGPG
ncbi:hypothetical protein GCM10010109_18140 [Actinoplanes campanulatus]|nr:hypothetical protein GCM10010109_18140 [Actinoplanes campanulatus]GID36332.1 hypothetical protein Aca09nite_28380 [Actinoplanes campanulatus]